MMWWVVPYLMIGVAFSIVVVRCVEQYRKDEDRPELDIVETLIIMVFSALCWPAIILVPVLVYFVMR